MPHAHAQTNPDRQLSGRHPTPRGPGTAAAGEGSIGFSDRDTRGLCADAVRPGTGRADPGRARVHARISRHVPSARKMSWRWVDRRALLLLHAESLAEHGGGEGLRDSGLLESALARPENLAAYGNPDFADLAASYGLGVA